MKKLLKSIYQFFLTVYIFESYPKFNKVKVIDFGCGGGWLVNSLSYHHGNKIEITGRLERYRDFVFISDVVDALMLIPKSKKNWIFYIGSGKKIKVRKIIKLILKNLKPKKIKLKITKGFHEDTWGSYANNSLMLTQGWKPKVNILPWLKNFCNNMK